MNANRKIVTRLVATVSISLLFVAFYLLSYERSQAERVLYTGKENHEISLERAKLLANNFKISAKPGDLTAGYFGRNIFEKIMQQEGCVGIRIYNAVSEKGTPTYIIIGVDRNGNDLLSGPVGDVIVPCPPWCGGVSITEGEAGIALKN